MNQVSTLHSTLESLSSSHNQTSKPVQIETRTNPNVNIFKHENIRIFGYRDKYILVDSGDFVFMMFELHSPHTNNPLEPTVHAVDCTINCKLSALPMAKKMAFSEIDRNNLVYMCQYYLQSIFKKQQSIPFMVRAIEAKKKYGTSLDFAKLMAKTPSSTDFDKICEDMKDAHFYLQNKREWWNPLHTASKRVKKSILRKLLPLDTYDILNVDGLGNEYLQILINEIFMYE